MNRIVVGLLHPGEMGAAVGASLAGRGYPVLWASAGRSTATAGRARAAGLRDTGTAAELARRSRVILSICPPEVALTTARAVATALAGAPGAGTTGTPGARAAGERPVYLDANAVSPATAREIGRIVEDAGASYVDGGIIGPPPAGPGRCRLYLSGGQAPWVAGLFEGSALDARVLGPASGLASAIKMAYAGWTKGTAALILGVRALARAEGVEEALLAEWALSQPTLATRSQEAARSATAKGWRWVAEMEEIAASMAAARLPGGFHQAAAQVFRHVPRQQEAAPAERALAIVIEALLAAGPGRLSG